MCVICVNTAARLMQRDRVFSDIRELSLNVEIFIKKKIELVNIPWDIVSSIRSPDMGAFFFKSR